MATPGGRSVPGRPVVLALQEMSWGLAGTLGRVGVTAENSHQAQAEQVQETPKNTPVWCRVSPLGKLAKWPGWGCGTRKDVVLVLPQAGGVAKQLLCSLCVSP